MYVYICIYVYMYLPPIYMSKYVYTYIIFINTVIISNPPKMTRQTPMTRANNKKLSVIKIYHYISLCVAPYDHYHYYC